MITINTPAPWRRWRYCSWYDILACLVPIWGFVRLDDALRRRWEAAEPDELDRYEDEHFSLSKTLDREKYPLFIRYRVDPDGVVVFPVQSDIEGLAIATLGDHGGIYSGVELPGVVLRYSERHHGWLFCPPW